MLNIKKSLVTAIFAVALTQAFSLSASAQELVVGGEAVGIQISTDGVMVAGLSEIETQGGTASPAKDAGISEGDVIIGVDGAPVSDASELIDILDRNENDSVSLDVRRGDSKLSLSVSPVENTDGQYMLGILLRDGMSGIGTLTFSDPESGVYGALGHGINDGTGGGNVPLREGSIYPAQVTGVVPGTPGAPGELSGCADADSALGTIERNTDMGIFGTLYTQMAGRTMDTGVITAGPASILASVSGSAKKEYSIEINRVYRESDGTHAMLSVTDPELIARTGGIVQGMSGSPIIQNGKLVGAVTHVFVSDPTKGYALSIQDMMRAAGIAVETAA